MGSASRPALADDILPEREDVLSGPDMLPKGAAAPPRSPYRPNLDPCQQKAATGLNHSSSVG